MNTTRSTAISSPGPSFSPSRLVSVATPRPRPRALIVSFDLVRDGEPPVSLSIATLLAAAGQRPEVLSLEHQSFNLLASPAPTADGVVEAVSRSCSLQQLDVVALSAYVWSEPLLRPVMRGLRAAGFSGRFVLGGYEVSYSDDADLRARYPDVDAFVKGYAEVSLLDAVEDACRQRTYASVPDFATLPSPYLTGVLPVEPGQARVRMETKRGCPYRCSFCAHRDLTENRVHRYTRDRALDEFAFFEQRGVQKVNVLDPVFNMGNEYLPLLRHLATQGYRPALSFQSRLENVRGPMGDEFVDLCTGLDVTLEFGIQSIHADELGAVARKNNLEHDGRVLRQLNDQGVAYEVSLIYGMPHQTVASFEATLAFLQDAGCAVVKAFPLMLLRGTELHARRAEYGFQERPMGEFGIPTVVASASFSEDDWLEMQAIADGLEPAERV